LSGLHPPPQLPKFKHSREKSGPNFKDRRKAMIEQTHFFQNSQKKHQTNGKASCRNAEIVQAQRANVCSVPDTTSMPQIWTELSYSSPQNRPPAARNLSHRRVADPYPLCAGRSRHPAENLPPAPGRYPWNGVCLSDRQRWRPPVVWRIQTERPI
jgi:hypothetical protein